MACYLREHLSHPDQANARARFRALMSGPAKGSA
jgi:hypothetical protein